MAGVAEAARTVDLVFCHHDHLAHADEPLRVDLSAVAAKGRTLWVANDETATVERLIVGDDGTYADHEPFHLGDVFDLPDGAHGEMDIEGLDVAGDYLWIVGSHSLKRRKPKAGEHDAETALERLTDLKSDPNRHFLGRVPIVESGIEGVFDLRMVANASEGDRRGLGCLKITKKGGKLDDLLKADEHIARFMTIPAKENGFDIEGLAVCGSRVFLGLRGPVLRGWAIIIELDLKESKPGRLKPREIGDDRDYVKHFLDLQGLGIRELIFDGESLLILAGPTMDISGPVELFRWAGALDVRDDDGGPAAIVPRDALVHVLSLPHGQGVDHAEGLAWLPSGGRELLVVYDSPSRARRHDDPRSVRADVFEIPQPE